MIAVFVLGSIGRRVATRAQRWLLVAIWLAEGALLLWLPFLLPDQSSSSDARVHVFKIIVAALLGGLLSCVWLGWYLAVSLEFNGHYSEAGGAARIEEYKEFIRIRLAKDSLKAYVIGIDKPRPNGKTLKPKLIDVFELTPS
jgi:hypothetical protein